MRRRTSKDSKKDIDKKQSVEESVQEKYSLTSGPFPKSIYTCQLEALTRKLINNTPFTIEQRAGADYIKFNDDPYPYNLTDIFKYANLEHLLFKSDDFDKYSRYLTKDSIQRSKLITSKSIKGFKDYGDYLKSCYPDLHIAEMHAINIYTGNFYWNMNALLRGVNKFYNPKKYKDVILHTVFCGSALAKLSDTDISVSYRREFVFDAEIHRQRIQLAGKQGVTELSGFVSTSYSSDLYSGGYIHFTFTNLRGKDIANLSQCRLEFEFLIPPTMIQIKKHTRSQGIDYFEASLVRDVASLKPEQCFTTLAEIYEHKLRQLPEELELYLDTQIKRMSEPTFLNWIRSLFFDSEVVQDKIKQFRECLDQVTTLKNKNAANFNNTQITAEIDKISRLIENAARIRRSGPNSVYTNTTSATQLLEVKKRLAEIKEIDPVANTSNCPKKS